MTINSTPFGQTVSSMAKDPVNKQDGPFGQQVSALAQEKKFSVSDTNSQLNLSILQVSFNISEGNGDGAMSLLFKTALEGINDVLRPELGDNAIQKAYESGLDVSPEATSDRIVQMSTAFFDAYYSTRQDMPLDEALESFVKVIGGGIDQGFKEARDILGGLKVLEGDIASNIDKTYDLVQQGLQAFLQNYQSSREA
ncbi:MULTISPECIES: DUF5610 domain-containing protein [unclassified Methylophaga]|jgi:hypothetical protein|uniref:DUF5610 domain-containing protein n=1 Tax=unclassified Methylophaga TaxID=2629249 RepID=UPI000C8EE60C|nr:MULTISPECIES: DUF5610 domain-containing protein [unclassified Methylophaga]MAK67111.1 hypothetical protein [Methylophaga sp.]MAY18149.1 hypothetical protein [Methylophaga sp.]MBN45572.1 hypothetical protein [Methylophaga sp.]HAO24395.1 hypothetical protein [Methylophaga sp.]HCD06363.1 hypothetical protein [Methylophaga sp.]